MKNILYGLLATLLFCNFSFAQLMSDEEHRIMMNNFAIQLNNNLTYNCPQGVTVDQYKRGIVDGTYTLSQMMQDILIQNYTQPLKDYGSQFATAKGLTANTDALKYFYSTFAPSTTVQNGKLVESTTSAGLTATEMWTCALETFGTSNCGSSVLVSDKSNLSILATTSINKLTAVPGNIGMLVMLDDYNICLKTRIKPELFDFVGQGHNEALAYTYSTVISRISNYTFTDIKNSNDYYLTHLYKYSDGIDIDNSFITESYINSIVADSQNHPLSYFTPTFSSTAKNYLDRLGAIVDEDLSALYDNNTILQIKTGKINNLNREIARSNLNDFEVSSLYMANSMGKSSLQYWQSNKQNWNQYTGRGIGRWWRNTLADIGGFVKGFANKTAAEKTAVQTHVTQLINSIDKGDLVNGGIATLALINDAAGPWRAGADASCVADRDIP